MLALPKSRAEIGAVQSKRKRRAVEQARRAPFYAGKLDHIDLNRLDDADEWRKIPILTKDMLRSLSDGDFYDTFCVKPDDGIAEFWRSGGATGTPLFYPRSFTDIRYAMVGFSRIYQCAGCPQGGRAHVSFPLGIHPVGQMLARCATDVGIAVNWAGSGTTTPSAMQIELIDRLKPTIWMGMSSYGLHLANLAEARGIDLSASSVKTILCSAEPLSDAKRAKLSHQWGAQVRDTFGMTEAGMMGAEDSGGGGFRIWTDMFFVEVLDPDTNEPVVEGTDLLVAKSKAAVILHRMLPSEIVSSQTRNWSVDGIVCYSKICTHVGCPISLNERTTHHLLCPCHQSTFDLADSGRVLFGPAARALPQLEITVDDEGYLVARRDFTQPVGPSFWERG